ncbi:MAG: amidohydrolase family protein [Lentisphaeria bacterium]|nr:amidohydrolase family protein [Lentisphaeria bacterium]
MYLDPSCSFPDAPKIDESVRRVGAEKVVFGSSMMENNPGFTIGMIQDALITDAEKEAIFHGNAERLFGL